APRWRSQRRTIAAQAARRRPAPSAATNGSSGDLLGGMARDERAGVLGHEDVLEREASERRSDDGDLFTVGGSLVDNDAVLALDLAQATGAELSADQLIRDADRLLVRDLLELLQLVCDLSAHASRWFITDRGAPRRSRSAA